MVVTDEDVAPRRLQYAFALGERKVRGDVENEIEALRALREVFLGVVDDSIRAKPSEHVELLGAVDSGHTCSMRFSKLYGDRTDASSRPVDHHVLSWLDPTPALQVVHRDEPGGWNRGSLLECDAAGLQGERVLWSLCVFGKRTTVPPLEVQVGFSENLVTETKASDGSSYGLDLPREVGSRDGVFRLEHPTAHQTENVGPPRDDVPHVWMDRGGANANQHFVIPDDGPIDLP